MIVEEQNPADTTSQRAPTSSVLEELKDHRAMIKSIYPGAVSSKDVVYRRDDTMKKSAKLAESKKSDANAYTKRYNEKIGAQQS